jgi:hypothetical protein
MTLRTAVAAFTARALRPGNQTTGKSPIVPGSSTAGFPHSLAYLLLMGSGRSRGTRGADEWAIAVLLLGPALLRSTGR